MISGQTCEREGQLENDLFGPTYRIMTVVSAIKLLYFVPVFWVVVCDWLQYQSSEQVGTYDFKLKYYAFKTSFNFTWKLPEKCQSSIFTHVLTL